MHFLEAMQQHGSVNLLKEVPIDVDLITGRDAEHVHIERSVVDLAESKPVGHRWKSVLVSVGSDVRRVEQLTVAKAADGAASVVGRDHPSSKLGLVQSLPDDTLGVPALCAFSGATAKEADALVKGEQELATIDEIIDDKDWRVRHVDPIPHLAEQDDGQAKLECSSQLGVVAVDRPLAVGVVEQATLNLSV